MTKPISTHIDHKGMTSNELVRFIADKLIFAAEAGRAGKEVDLLLLPDTDGSTTYNPETGFPWVDADVDSRIHPWIARAYVALSEVPGVQIATSSGGGVERTAIVYEASHLAGRVNGFCGYGTETLTWEAGRPVLEYHPFSEHVAEFWEVAQLYLETELQERFPQLDGRQLVSTEPVRYRSSLETWDGRGVWFQVKGTHVSVHERASKLRNADGTEFLPDVLGEITSILDEFVRSRQCQEWIESKAADPAWGPEDADDRAELVRRLVGNLETANMNAGREILINLGLHKDTVLEDCVEQMRPSIVIKISDDKGDVKGMKKAHELRDTGVVDVLELAAVYPIDDKGRRTNDKVRELADFEFVGAATPDEDKIDFQAYVVNNPSAQGQFGMALTHALMTAIAKRPDLFDPTLLTILHTPLSELHTLSPHMSRQGTARANIPELHN